jgi:hypothetical protein
MTPAEVAIVASLNSKGIAMDVSLTPITPQDALSTALSHIGAVVACGLQAIPDDIDREHLVQAHAILTQLSRSQRAAT